MAELKDNIADMIAVYDEVKESVRRYEDKLKGKGECKGGKHENGKLLSMSVILEKNKTIEKDQRHQKLKKIKARKLKVKIS
jgi:hypothetical protein